MSIWAFQCVDICILREFLCGVSRIYFDFLGMLRNCRMVSVCALSWMVWISLLCWCLVIAASCVCLCLYLFVGVVVAVLGAGVEVVGDAWVASMRTLQLFSCPAAGRHCPPSRRRHRVESRLHPPLHSATEQPGRPTNGSKEAAPPSRANPTPNLNA